MSSRIWRMSRMLAVFSMLYVAPSVSLAQEGPGKLIAQNITEMKFGPTPGFPTCASGAVQSGDPAAGPSILFGRLDTGCVVPWHWHTPNEYLMMVSGVAQVQPKDGKAFTLRAGGFALMPSRHVHQFRCVTACRLFVHSDAPFDTHYVDGQGNELSPEDALKAVKETVAKPR